MESKDAYTSFIYLRNIRQTRSLTQDELDKYIQVCNYAQSVIKNYKDGCPLFENIFDLVLWETYINALIGEIPNEKPKLYRGHKNSEWKLIPSICREGINYDLESKKTKQGAKLLLRNIPESQEIDCFTFLAILQHYGYKTPFIDFTSDLLIAAAFSCLRDNAENYPESGAIIRIIEEDYKQFVPNIETSIGHKLIVKADNITRIRNQKGLFFFAYKPDIFEMLCRNTRYYFKHGKESEEFINTTKIDKIFLFPNDDYIYQLIIDNQRKINKINDNPLNATDNRKYEEIINIVECNHSQCENNVTPQDYYLLIQNWFDYKLLSIQQEKEIKVLCYWFWYLQKLSPLFPKQSLWTLYKAASFCYRFNLKAEDSTDIFATYARKESIKEIVMDCFIKAREAIQ